MLAKALLMRKKKKSLNLFSGLQIDSYGTYDKPALYIPANTNFVVSKNAFNHGQNGLYGCFDVFDNNKTMIERIRCDNWTIAGDRIYTVLCKNYDIYYVGWNWVGADYTQVELGTEMTPYMPYDGGE